MFDPDPQLGQLAIEAVHAVADVDEIVGDLFEIVPEMIRQLDALKAGGAASPQAVPAEAR